MNLNCAKLNIKDKIIQLKDRKIIEAIKSIQNQATIQTSLTLLNELDTEQIIKPIKKIFTLPNRTLLIFNPKEKVNLLNIILEAGNEILLQAFFNKLEQSKLDIHSIKEITINQYLDSFFKREEIALEVNLTQMLDLLIEKLTPLTWHTVPTEKNDLHIEYLSIMHDSYLHKAIKASFKNNPAHPHPFLQKPINNINIPFYLKVAQYDNLVNHIINNGFLQMDEQGDLLSLAIGYNDKTLIDKLFTIKNINIEYANQAIQRCEVVDNFLKEVPNHYNLDDSNTTKDTLEYLKMKVEHLSLEKLLNEKLPTSSTFRLKI